MRRFVIGAVVGAGLMYFYLYQYGDWRGWASGKFNKVRSEYSDSGRRSLADQAVR
jgi:hypothetical protein